MKRIKTYKIFNESEFDSKITDEPDLKMAKDSLSITKSQLSEYKSKKSLLDNAFLKIKSDADLNLKVDEIVGKADQKTPKNPFLIEYLHIAKLKRKVDKLQNDIVNDKIRKDDFSQELRLSSDSNMKASINAKITDIANRISTNTSNISSLMKEISDSQKSLDNKMRDIEKNMMDNIKKISS